MFDIYEYIKKNGIVEQQNLEHESSRQDCQILRQRYGSDLFERCWIANDFTCTNCGRQLSIVDLFDSSAMAHRAEFLRDILTQKPAGQGPLVVSGTMSKEAVPVACDCGHTDNYRIPGFAILNGTFSPFVYTRSCTCYNFG